jgi:hypothetical protein
MGLLLGNMGIFGFLCNLPSLKDNFTFHWDNKIVYSTSRALHQLSSPNPHNLDSLEVPFTVEPHNHTYIVAKNDKDLVTLHLKLEDQIHIWLKNPQSCLHPFFETWNTWNLKDIPHHNLTWLTIQDAMGITTFHAYVDAMNKCPIILQLYDLVYHESGIKYRYIPDPSTNQTVSVASLQQDIINLNDQLCKYNVHFEASIQKLNQQLTNHDLHIVDSMGTIKQHLQDATNNLSNTVTYHKNTLDSFVKGIKNDIHTHAMDTITDFKVELHNTTTDAYASFKANITEIFNDSLTTKLPTFTSSVQDHIDTVTSDVLNQFQSFTKNFKDQASIIISDALNTFNAHNDKHNDTNNIANGPDDIPLPKMHPKFNVDPSFAAHLLRQSPNNIPAHLRSPASNSEPHYNNNNNSSDNNNNHAYHHHNNPTSSKPVHSDKHASYRPNTPTTEYDGPTFIPSPRAAETISAQPHIVSPPGYFDPYGHRAPQFSPDGLPTLNADQFSRRVKLQLTTVDDILVFYTQLMNQSSQWGILLEHPSNIKHDTSLCTTHYNGQPITATRYQAMASLLYEFLSKYDTIPVDLTGPLQIISQLALANDGYLVLYAMLKTIHPGLSKDAIVVMPEIAECTDIFDYATKCNKFFTYEKCAGRPYAHREKVVRFMLGLSVDSQYANAIERADTLLATWQPWDIKGPEQLQLLDLPNYIDSILRGTHGKPIIRAVRMSPNHCSNNNRQHSHPTNNRSRDSKPLKDDTICDYCGIYGHKRTNCSYIKRWLKTMSVVKTMDNTTRSKIMDTYEQEQNQHKLQSKVKTNMRSKFGMIRKLIESGQLDDAEAIWDCCLQDDDAYNLDYLSLSSDAHHEE